MKTQDLRNYGVAFSDAEGAWSKEVKAKMKRGAMGVMLSHIPLLQRPRFFYTFMRAKMQASSIDLSDLHEKGMTNQRFLQQQLDYLAAFTALVTLFDKDRAVEIMKEVMDVTASEPLLLCLPEVDNVRQAGEPMEVFREYFRAMPEASRKAACNDISIAEDSPDAFQFNVNWCVWLELAQRMNIPEGCQPNCYSDDLAFPKYFEELGIRYKRTNTLACGGNCCDFRFEKIADED